MYAECSEREQLEIALEQVLDAGGAQNPIARDLLRRWALALRAEINETLTLEQEVFTGEDGKTTEVDWLLGLFQDLTDYRAPR